MLKTAFLAVLFVGVIGFAIKLVLTRMGLTNYYGKLLRITATEFVTALVAVSFIIVPSVWGIGKHISVNQQLKYKEFYNGVELKPVMDITTCRAGHKGNSKSDGQSNCHYTFVSGSYHYPVTYTVTVCSTDAKGKSSCHSETRCCHYPKAYIYSPYATKEYRYSVPDSLGGSYGYPGVYLANQPVPATSRSIPEDYPRGAPSDWLDAKSHFDSGDPRPVTRVFSYDNPILATNDKFLKANDVNVKQYLKAKLLPEHTVNILQDPIYGPSNRQAKKVAFVDVSVADPNSWQDALMRFNAACGMKLQCDMHVVIINSVKVPRDNAGQYVQALKAYWQGDHFGKRAISKNAIILAMGTSDGKTVDWANATTGMPYGNNVMLESMASSLPGKMLDPTVIFGSPRTIAIPYKDKDGDTKFKASVTHTNPSGVVEAIVFSDSYGFQRPCMESCTKGEVGYKDLIKKINPSTGAKTWMIVIICFISLFFWWFVAATSYAEFSTYYHGTSRKKSKSKSDHNSFDHYMEWSNK